MYAELGQMRMAARKYLQPHPGYTGGFVCFLCRVRLCGSLVAGLSLNRLTMGTTGGAYGEFVFIV